MKKVNLVLSCLSLLSIMTACKDPSGSGSEDGKTKISFFGWGSAEEQENFQILIDEFMKDNPDVKVVYSAASSTSYMTTLKNKGKNLPDVFYIPDYEFIRKIRDVAGSLKNAEYSKNVVIVSNFSFV